MLRVPRLARVAFSMLRYRAALTLWIFFLLGAARHGGAGTLTLKEGAGLLTLALGYLSATTVNDVCDQDVDRINHPDRWDRPLNGGRASVGELWTIHLLSSLGALAAGAIVGPGGALLAVSSLAINHAYSVRPLRLSRRTYLAPLLLTGAYVVLPYAFGAVAAGSGLGGRDAILLAALALLFTARIVLKDFRDRPGDARFGKPTLLLRRGKAFTLGVSAVAAAAGAVLLVAGIDGPWWMAGAIAVHAGLGLWALRLVARADQPAGEQFAISLAARMANGLLLSMLGYVILAGMGAPQGPRALLVLAMTGVSAASFIRLRSEPRSMTPVTLTLALPRQGGGR
jgi:4-hydroxybenzoate polyprenyltransferase